MTQRANLTPDDLSAFRGDLVGLARHLGLSREAAEDAAQTCLLEVLAQLQAGREIARPRAYLKTALRHACARHHRKQTPESGDRIDAEPSRPDAENSLLLREVRQAFSRLPAEQAALLMRVADGETSPARLAQEFDLPTGTIMSRLARGRARLRSELGMAEDETVL